MAGLRETALMAARSQIGVREESPNWGVDVKTYLEAAGIRIPAPWCAAFVNWVAEIAAQLLGVVSPLEEIKHQALAHAYYEWAKKNGYLVKPEEVLPGDLFVLWFPSLGRYGHIGFVDRIDLARKSYWTIEGNSNSNGSREGVEVCQNERWIGSRVQFIRWTRKVHPIASTGGY